MKILGIETSCDETAASIVENGTKILSNVIASSLPIHAKTGGIIPENAAREQIKYIIPVVNIAIKNSGLEIENLDAIAVTFGPGLIGSLLVGIETAKTLAYVWKKPIIPVNHLIGHIYANFISENPKSDLPAGGQNPKLNARRYTLDANIEFPAIVLIVSGGHTDLLLMKGHASPAMPAHSAGGRGKLKWLGGTRDDAAGEAFDKIARLLNLPYPGGPSISSIADKFKAHAISKIILPRPMINSQDFDFSFSGLKTAVLREVNKFKEKQQFNNLAIQQLAYAVQEAVTDVLIAKIFKAANKYKVKSILLSGGVSANQKLRNKFKEKNKNEGLNFKIFYPKIEHCTDNGAMIASAAFFNYRPIPWQKITANPELHFI